MLSNHSYIFKNRYLDNPGIISNQQKVAKLFVAKTKLDVLRLDVLKL